MHGRVLAWPRGKLLGGSSAINFLMWTHASRIDLDNWEALGNAGWNFDSLQPYYRKSETYNPPSDEITKALGTSIFDPALHGNAGPIQTSFPKGVGPLDQAWGPTWAALGLSPKADPRKGDTLGCYSILKQMNTLARRSHAGQGYYLPIAERENLTVLTNAHVSRVVISTAGSSPKATGVEYSVGQESSIVSARKEVLLCAGTIQSPQLLELSGIGSKSVLEEHGIDVVVDNANVGENLQVSTLI
jgi:choline dehydrogenase